MSKTDSLDPYVTGPSKNADSESSTRLNPPTVSTQGSDVDLTGAAEGSTQWVLNHLSPTALTALASGSSVSGPTIDILRKPGTTLPVSYDPHLGGLYGKQTVGEKRATPDQYAAEYWTKAMKDPKKRQWLADRGLVLWSGITADPNSPYGVATAEFQTSLYNMWKWAGDQVQLDPSLKDMTPEQLLDALYQQAGGDNALAVAKAEKNPITTTTARSVSSATMSQAEANAIADQVAMATLGRMASDAEMKRARKAMNALMKANPTVSTTTTVSDQTDPNNPQINSTTHTQEGVSAQTAQAAYEQKLRRSSEGMAFGVGKLMEQAMAGLDRGL